MVGQVTTRGRYDQTDFRFEFFGSNYPQNIEITNVLPRIRFCGWLVVRTGRYDQTDFRFEFVWSNYPHYIEIINVLPRNRFCGWSSDHTWSNGSSDQEIRDHRIRITI